MSHVGLSPVNAYTAHNEWKRRPPDQRYNGVRDLLAATRARRAQTVEYQTDAVALHVEATGLEGEEGVTLLDDTGQPTALTHWSFGQLASIAGAPADYLRTLPAPIAADALNHGLLTRMRVPQSKRRRITQEHQLYIDRATPRTALAITSPQYVRVHHDHLVSRVADLMAAHPQWHLPLAYKNGQWGAERVPSGAYLGDHDLFLFLVDGNRDIEDPTNVDAGLFRGFILRNSDVGAAALTLDCFLFRYVCGNHIIWGFQHVASFRRKHVGHSIDDAWRAQLAAVSSALDADTASDRALLHRAARYELGPSREKVVETAMSRAQLSKKQATIAFDLAEAYEPNPRSVWGFVQGLTLLSQRSHWQDQRYALDRAASRLLRSVH